MERNKDKEAKEEEVGITNRGLEQEKPGQEYVMDSVEGMEADGKRDDLNTGDRLMDDGTRLRRNLEPTVDGDNGLTLTPDEQSGGVRRIDSRDAGADHSHH
jgi:hypothetical protein